MGIAGYDYPHDEPERVKCERCNGTGKIYTAWNIDREEEFEVSEPCYASLPENEEEAWRRERSVCRGDCGPCPDCEGEGWIEVEPYEEDPDDWREERMLEKFLKEQ